MVFDIRADYERRLQQAIERNGENSPTAEMYREQLRLTDPV